MDTYVLNYTRQSNDNRDIKLPLILHKDINTRVFSLDRTKFKIYDQGKLGSCVSNAISSCVNYYNYTINPSRLYIYFNARAMNKNINDDTGIAVRDGCKSIFNYHTCDENDWIYDITNFTKMPSLNCYMNSYNYKNFIYYSVSQDLAQLKTSLLSNNPIMFGFIVYTNFKDASGNGIVPMPTETDSIVGENSEYKVIGGHCSICIGFDDNTQHFVCVNSWSDKWGDKGFFYMPYQYIIDPALAFDFTVINFDSPTPIVIPKSTKVKTNLKMQFM